MSQPDSNLPSDHAAARERELLSAFMDGETGEHEFRQVLKATGDAPALRDTHARWELARSVLRGESAAAVDIRAAVAAALDREMSARPAATSRRWLQPLASAAVAAAVAVVTVFGWQSLQPGSVGTTLAGNGTEAQSVALGPMVVLREDGEELVLADDESPTAGQDRLNSYLARHAQAAGNGGTGVSPYARVVSFEGEQGR